MELLAGGLRVSCFFSARLQGRPRDRSIRLQGALSLPFSAPGTPPMVGTGLESPSDSPQKRHVSGLGGTESGTVGTQNADLAKIVLAWPSLGEPIRRAILVLVASPSIQDVQRTGISG